MKVFIFAIIPLVSVVLPVTTQYSPLWRGGPYNPWNNPDHPANVMGVGPRSPYAHLGGPYAMGGPLASSDNFLPPRYKSLEGFDGNELPATTKLRAAMAARREAVQERMRAAAELGAPFRPKYVTEMMKQRASFVGDRMEFGHNKALARFQQIAKRREILKEMEDSSEPMSFGLLMKAMHRAYGQEMARQNMEFRRYLRSAYRKPFLRPVVSFVAPDGLSKDTRIESKLYQDLQEQRGTLLKDKDIFVVTKISNFSGDSLHLGVDLFGVNETSEGAPNGMLHEDELDLLQDKIFDSQLSVAEEALQRQKAVLEKMKVLPNSNEFLDKVEIDNEIAVAENKLRIQINLAKAQVRLLQKEILKKQKSLMKQQMEMEREAYRAQKEFLKESLEEQLEALKKRTDLSKDEYEEQKELLKRSTEEQLKALSKQNDLIEKSLESQFDLLEKQVQQAGESAKFEMDVAQNQISYGHSKVDLEDELLRQQAIMRMNFVRQKMDRYAGTHGDSRHKRSTDAFKFAKKQQELFDKQMKKEEEYLLKQLEKQRDALKKETEKEADALKKQEELEKKMKEKEQDLAKKQAEKEYELMKKQAELEKKQYEKEQELLKKQAEKEYDLMKKKMEKENDAAEKQAELEKKMKEKEQDLAKKQMEKEKDAAEKQAELEKKQYEKDQELLKKQAEIEYELMKKQMEQEKDAAEKQADLEKKMKEKEQDLAEKQAEKDSDLMKKQMEKEEDAAEKQAEFLKKEMEKQEDAVKKQNEKESDAAKKVADLKAKQAEQDKFRAQLQYDFMDYYDY